MSYRVLIIDDEELARKKVTRLCAEHRDIEIIGYAINGPEAVEKIDSMQPDLIFLDIQMPGFTGFEVLQQIQKTPLVVFTTAYDAFALEAFETNSIDYLMKPIKQSRFDKAVDKLRAFSTKNNDESEHFKKIKELLELSKINSKRVKVKTGSEILFLPIDEIYYFKALDKYTEVATKERKHLINDTLTELEADLPQNFARVHRSSIINKDYLHKLKRSLTGKYCAIMSDGDHSEIAVSRTGKEKLV